MLHLYNIINIYKPLVRNRKAISERQADLINIDQASFRHSSICRRSIALSFVRLVPPTDVQGELQ